MLNILIPLGSKSNFFEGPEYPYPTPLIEVLGVPMIERVIENLRVLDSDVRFIFVLKQEDCAKYYLDKTLKLLAGENCQIIQIEKETKGAACSCLLAIGAIDKESPLVIANADQVFDVNLKEYFQNFKRADADAGCLYFNSVLPRWSYIKLDEQGAILEAAEKQPISRNAIAGFYYFSQGKNFVSSAMKSIINDAQVHGRYYIAPVLNELILQNKKLIALKVENQAYHSFYSPQKIEEYEVSMGRRERRKL